MSQALEACHLIPCRCIVDDLGEFRALVWIGQDVGGNSEPLGALPDVCPVVCHHECMQVTLHLMNATDRVLWHGNGSHVIHSKVCHQLQVIGAGCLMLKGTFHGALLTLVCQTDLDLDHVGCCLKVLTASSDDVDATGFVDSLVTLHEMKWFCFLSKVYRVSV